MRQAPEFFFLPLSPYPGSTSVLRMAPKALGVQDKGTALVPLSCTKLEPVHFRQPCPKGKAGECVSAHACAQPVPWCSERTKPSLLTPS